MTPSRSYGTPTLGVGVGRRATAAVAGGCLLLAILVPSGALGQVSRPIDAFQERPEESPLLERERPDAAFRPEFEFLRFEAYPSGVFRLVKPGQWNVLSVQMVANHDTFTGWLRTNPLDLPGMAYTIQSARPALLPQAQYKNLDVVVFVPATSQSVPLELSLYGRRGSLAVERGLSRLAPLAPHQFFFVVLSRMPEQYHFLRELPSLVPALAERDISDSPRRHYQLAYPLDPEGPAPLSAHPLAWSSVAYVLWDDYDPAQLSSEQQQALLDWLHWGGQLVVTGHRSLLSLRGSFLEPYLPADPEGTFTLHELPGLEREFPGPQVVPRHERSRTASKDRAEPDPLTGIPIPPEAPLAVTKLRVRPSVGRPLITTDQSEDVLVAERRVGRGRVVVCAFRLAERPLAVWPGFDHFFNSIILRRLGRVALGDQTEWDFGPQLLGWKSGTFHPRRISQVRYFSRDSQLPDAVARQLAQAIKIERLDEGDEEYLYGSYLEEDELWEDPAASEAVTPGVSQVAAWDDFNAVSHLARQLLHAASGLTIPRTGFVAQVLIAYLVLLVPLNWLVFRLLGRLERAWAVAPIISLAFAGVILKLSQWNIGYQRAANEIDIVEAHADYPRAHVTRYTALYTAMRTRFLFRYEDPTAVALPFPVSTAMPRGQRVERVTFHWGLPVRLEPFLLQPNSLGMAHAEQMFDMKGAFSWKPDGIPIPAQHREEPASPGGTLVNQTLFDLQSAVVIGPGGGEAQIGPLPAGARVEVRFPDTPLGDAQARSDSNENQGFQPMFWPEDRSAPAELFLQGARTKSSADEQPEPQLAVEPLLRLAQETCPSGEVRLVGWSDEPVPGQEIEPALGRHRAVTVFVVHLEPAPLPLPTKDQPWRR